VLEEGDISVRRLLANGQLHFEHRLSPAFFALEAIVLQGVKDTNSLVVLNFEG